MTDDLAILIMAAGKASRFGSCKQLIKTKDKSLLQRSIEQAQQVCPNHVFVATGAWHNEIVKTMNKGQLSQVELLYCPDWFKGIGHSIATAITSISNQYQGILILLADQVAVKAEDLFQLSKHFTKNNIVCSYYDGQRGVPAIFGINSFDQLQSLEGDQGAKKLLYRSDIDVVEYQLQNASIDIDTVADLKNWNNRKFYNN